MKFLFDLIPVILFFAAFKLYDIYVATAVAIVATFMQIGWMWLRYRKVDKMLWISLVIIVLLGGATLALQNDAFIKWKPTVLYWIFALALLISNLFFNKNLIRMLLEKQLVLPVSVWNKVNLSWVGFFVLMGGLNIHIAFNYSIDTWVNFKLFGSMGLMLAFIVVQGAMLAKYISDSTDAKVENSIDPSSKDSENTNIEVSTPGNDAQLQEIVVTKEIINERNKDS